MPANFKWDGEAVRARIEAEMGRRLDAAALALATEASRALSVPGPGPSTPPDPPHKQTGRGRASVATEPAGRFVRRVGTNVFYLRIHELGLHNFPARPWLRPALARSTAKIREILGRPFD